MAAALRIPVFVLFLVSALICYQIGFALGIIAIVLLGVVFELLFWVGVFNFNKKSDVG